MKPIDAIKETLVKPGFSQPVRNYEEKLIDVGMKVNKDPLVLYGR